MRLLGPILLAALLAVSCGDGTGGGTSEPEPAGATEGTDPGVVAGPTTSSTEPPDCLVLADEYLDVAAALFGGPPDDQVVESSRDRFEELDVLASAGGCGEGYREAVCDGLDELSRAGTLVIYPMVTARCI